MFKGCVIGYIPKPTTNVYFVATERRTNVKGKSVDVVFSKKCYDLGDVIEYKFTKRGKEYIAFA